MFLRDTISGIYDPIRIENYCTIALRRDRKFHVCSHFRWEIVFPRNTRPDESVARPGAASRVDEAGSSVKTARGDEGLDPRYPADPRLEFGGVKGYLAHKKMPTLLGPT